MTDRTAPSGNPPSKGGVKPHPTSRRYGSPPHLTRDRARVSLDSTTLAGSDGRSMTDPVTAPKRAGIAALA